MQSTLLPTLARCYHRISVVSSARSDACCPDVFPANRESEIDERHVMYSKGKLDNHVLSVT